jgi:NADH:ubiquinone oxidoreductase subunit C
MEYSLNLHLLSYIHNLVESINLKNLLSFFYKYFQLVCNSNPIGYFANLFNFKNLSLFKFVTLSDYSALHYPGALNEFEVNYLLLSYRLNFKCFLRLFINKDDLVLSINEIYANAN